MYISISKIRVVVEESVRGRANHTDLYLAPSFFLSVSNLLSQKITLFLGTLSDTKKRRRGDVTVLSVLDRPVLFLRYSERPSLLDLNYAVDRRNGFCVSKELLGTR